MKREKETFASILVFKSKTKKEKILKITQKAVKEAARNYIFKPPARRTRRTWSRAARGSLLSGRAIRFERAAVTSAPVTGGNWVSRGAAAAFVRPARHSGKSGTPGLGAASSAV